MDATEKDPSIIANAPTIPGYTILSRLGQGGMATVYLAIQECFGRKVALKVMVPSVIADTTYGERFVREAKIVARLSQPNIVPVYDVGVAGDVHYIAMEYLNGGDLSTRIRNGMSRDEIIRVGKEIATALDYAHRKGYVHRDVKPDNIMFREDGAAVLTDFGIARPAMPDANMTQVGKVVGTPKYMSPEQTKGEEIDNTSDIYALGIVIYEMLTGKVPFDGKDPFEIGIKHLKDPVPKLPENCAEFQHLVFSMLAKNKTKRLQYGRDVVDMLTVIDGGAPTMNLTAVSSPVLTASEAETIPNFHEQQQANRNSGSFIAADASERVGSGSPLPKREKKAPVLSIAIGVFTVLVLTFGLIWFAPSIAPNSPLMTANELLMSIINPDQAKLKKALADAQIAMDAENYIEPVGSSALDHYRSAMIIDAQNKEAQLGIRSIVSQLIIQTNTAVENGEFNKARQLIVEIKKIDPNASGLASAESALESGILANKEAEERARLAREQKLADERAAAAAAQQAELDAQRQAEAAQRQAEAAQRAADAAAAAREKARQDALAKAAAEEEERLRQEELARQQAEEEARKAQMTALRIKGLMGKADTYFARGDYHSPSQDNALDKYLEVLALQPDHAEAKQGVEKIVAIIIPEIQTMLESQQFSAAKNLFDKAKAASPTNNDLISLGNSKGW